MKSLLLCKACGATCWVKSSYDSTIDALDLDFDKVWEWDPESNCEHEDFDVIDEDNEREYFDDYD